MKFLIGHLLIILCVSGYSQSREIPYTQDDRDRLIRLEERMTALDQKMNLVEKNINTRMDGVESKLEFLSNLILVLITSMFGFVVLLIWDRKTTLKPVRKSQDELIDVLKKYAKEKDDKVLKKLLDKAATF